MGQPDVFLDIVFVLLFITTLSVAAVFFGRYLARVYSGDLSKGVPGRLEGIIYRFIGTSPEEETEWWDYSKNLLIFNAIGIAGLLFLLLIQGYLPLNPQGVSGFGLPVALNVAISFVTNTNWQVYSGEISASYLTQMLGFTVQNFLSASTGIVVAVALIRGIFRRTAEHIGNFWVDITRTVLYVLLPIAFFAALILCSQGVIQNLDPYVHAAGFDENTPQVLAMGPVASQESIKELGTNGGGFFNANSAHPFENPSPITNIFEIFLILIIPAAFPFMFGEIIGERKQGWALYLTMLIIFLIAFSVLYAAELYGNPLLQHEDITGIPMEGKEVRFSLGGTTLFATSTTGASCGAVNAMHDSFTPLGGLVPLLLILLGEVVFGGVGSGFYTLIAFVIIADFIAGLMIGRTPEYLGKKIEVWEMKMALIAVLTPGIIVLIMTGAAMVVPGATGAAMNPGPHGLSEIVYAFASMANNNGSAFAGLDATGLFYLMGGSIAMLVGRFVPAIAVLAIAGSMVRKKKVPSGSGTLQTASFSFVFWLILIITIVGVLTFFPLLSLGPLAEHFIMTGGR
ncbi:MAG: potassium-transporting ATPase subunit KdpA [Methanomicrobiales archaeon]|nr:potassium-transporting ATPase subunit KdpA [Methanomicrobiales archaeon]